MKSDVGGVSNLENCFRWRFSCFARALLCAIASFYGEGSRGDRSERMVPVVRALSPPALERLSYRCRVRRNAAVHSRSLRRTIG